MAHTTVRDIVRKSVLCKVLAALYNESSDRELEKSYKIMRMNMFAIQDKVNAYTENIRGLNLAVVKLMTIQMTKLPL
jgi:hypothetical protein